MLCVATLSTDVVSAAEPPLSATAEPRSVPPSLNWTVPVGEDPPDTVAVNVTFDPYVDGLRLLVRAVVVAVLYVTTATIAPTRELVVLSFMTPISSVVAPLFTASVTSNVSVRDPVHAPEFPVVVCVAEFALFVPLSRTNVAYVPPSPLNPLSAVSTSMLVMVLPLGMELRLMTNEERAFSVFSSM